VVYLKKLVTST